MNTLHYASRARNIINRPSVQQDPTQALIARLRDDVEILKKENGFLRGQLGMPLDYVIPGLAQMRPNETAAGVGIAPVPQRGRWRTRPRRPPQSRKPCPTGRESDPGDAGPAGGRGRERGCRAPRARGRRARG